MGKITLLLDTHIFLWWLFDDPHLPAEIRGHIVEAENTILISAASVWEITTKFRLGKLPQAETVARNVPKWICGVGFTALPVGTDHAQLAGEWKMEHRDPFDRMLAAQTEADDCADKGGGRGELVAFGSHGFLVNIFWKKSGCGRQKRRCSATERLFPPAGPFSPVTE
uniref:type II toxin-antitoxin system VapC family toxin n=1 Tax=Candidatus Electrothrix sp. TaxID=2170559 RepID=UPI0040571868